jgi:uncharacterized protein YsxB (DUF464 family)
MMKIRLDRTDTGLIRGFRISGHAGYGEYGHDILCAGISAIAQTVIGSLLDIAGVEPVYVLAEGDIRCELPDPATIPPDKLEACRILMESLALGCRQIQASYGSAYIQIHEDRFQ